MSAPHGAVGLVCAVCRSIVADVDDGPVAIQRGSPALGPGEAHGEEQDEDDADPSAEIPRRRLG